MKVGEEFLFLFAEELAGELRFQHAVSPEELAFSESTMQMSLLAPSDFSLSLVLSFMLILKRCIYILYYNPTINAYLSGDK